MLDENGKRDFSSEVPGTRLCGDITYLKTGEGWLYLATVIDLYTGMVIGWNMDRHVRTELCTGALAMARDHGYLHADAAVFHSDGETVSTGIPGVLDSHSDGRGRMLVPGALGVLDPHSGRQPLSFPGSVSPREYPVRRYASPPE
jgi:hypothetical protein